LKEALFEEAIHKASGPMKITKTELKCRLKEGSIQIKFVFCDNGDLMGVVDY
jgi:hypothetical protein